MNLEQNIKVNIEIAKAIKSKHDNDGFPGCFSKRDSLEVKYYLALLSDIGKARLALDSDGLAEILDDFDYNLKPTPAIQHGKLGEGKRKAKKEVKEGDPGSGKQEVLDAQ
jgi:hypothetical protein